MRFYKQMLQFAQKCTENGFIVIMPFVANADDNTKEMLDEMHREKIRMADYIYVVTDDSHYTGESTKSEMEFARSLGKPVHITVSRLGAEWMIEQSDILNIQSRVENHTIVTLTDLKWYCSCGAAYTKTRPIQWETEWITKITW